DPRASIVNSCAAGQDQGRNNTSQARPARSSARPGKTKPATGSAVRVASSQPHAASVAAARGNPIQIGARATPGTRTSSVDATQAMAKKRTSSCSISGLGRLYDTQTLTSGYVIGWAI